MFDTFEGFDEKDLEVEHSFENKIFNESASNSTEAFSTTSEGIVMSKVQNLERVVVKKGIFPDTAEGIDEKFLFVSLDMDLYKPMLSGLEFFYPKMVKGGVIVCHDYYSDKYSGVKRAVSEFEENNDLAVIPVGDGYSYAIIKV